MYVNHVCIFLSDFLNKGCIHMYKVDSQELKWEFILRKNIRKMGKSR